MVIFDEVVDLDISKTQLPLLKLFLKNLHYNEMTTYEVEEQLGEIFLTIIFR